MAERCGAGVGDGMTKVFNLGGSKCALLQVDGETVEAEGVKHATVILLMVNQGRGEDKDVVKNKSPKMLSIILWKVWTAFWRQKGRQRNSKRPKGVMLAVFGMLAGCMGIWK